MRKEYRWPAGPAALLYALLQMAPMVAGPRGGRQRLRSQDAADTDLDPLKGIQEVCKRQTLAHDGHKGIGHVWSRWLARLGDWLCLACKLHLAPPVRSRRRAPWKRCAA